MSPCVVCGEDNRNGNDICDACELDMREAWERIEEPDPHIERGYD
jgi:hypothetical protein